MIIVILATICLLIFLNGLYVAAEFSSVAVRRTRISQLAGQGNRLAQMLLPILEDSVSIDRYLAATQIGITISSLVLGAYGQNVVAEALVDPLTIVVQWAGPLLGNSDAATLIEVAQGAARSIAVTGVLILLTVLQVILGELLPKSVAIRYPERIALWVMLPMKWSLFMLRPLIWFFNGSGNLLLRAIPFEAVPSHSRIHSPEEIELLVTESHEGGLLDDKSRQMLRNTFRLRDLTARQVMIHRTRIVGAPIDSSVVDLMNIALEGGFSRIPLYQESIDDVVGFVHIKDLFRLHVEANEDIQSIIREVVYVPETLPIIDVWEKLNTKRKYLAVIFDEFGGTAGLITFEDLIEEIFGELQDEFDDEMAVIARDKDGRIHLRGDLLVSDVNEYLELELPEETADTLSGLVFSELGRPPTVEDVVTINGTVIRVEAMEDLGVSEVSLQLPPSGRPVPFSEWEMADYE